MSEEAVTESSNVSDASIPPTGGTGAEDGTAREEAAGTQALNSDAGTNGHDKVANVQTLTGDEEAIHAPAGATKTNGAGPPILPMPRHDVGASLNAIPPAAIRKEASLLAWLLHTAPLLFFVAVATSIALYDGVEVVSERLAPVYGFSFAVALGFFSWARWEWGSTPQCSNPRQYGKLAHWCTVLDSHISTWCADSAAAGREDRRPAERACRGAILQQNFVATSLGLNPAQSTAKQAKPTGGWQRLQPFRWADTGSRVDKVTGQRWMTGAGYVELWERLHRAEEDMFLVLPDHEIVAAGQYDEMRLAGSTIANRQGLLYRITIALNKLGGSIYLTTEPPAGPKGQDGTTGTKQDDRFRPILDERIAARYALREIRHAINEFRDAQRDGLVRVRSNLSWTGTLTGLVAFALFGLAMAFQAPVASIYGSAAIYLVGAVVGLFNSLSIGTEDDGAETEEDYGLSQARLLNSPMLSGLAALGGVVLAYIGIGALGDASSTTNDAGNFPKLWQIFDLEANPEAVAIAALFGLTPRLLIRRLQTEGDRYRQGLRRSSAPVGRNADTLKNGD